ncbi:nucleotidyl transferase AbiEii/AbiGii toxin family protein [Dermabacteraceae bacterium P13115]
MTQNVKSKHAQIVAALKREARAKGQQPNDLYNQFFREVFIYELMRSQQGWVLKGGSNIYCHIPGARQTKDLDLYRQNAPTGAVDAAMSLKSGMDGRKVGPYTFKIVLLARKRPAGTVQSERVEVEVRHGVDRFCKFSIDVSGNLVVSGPIKILEAPATCQVRTEFLPQTFNVYTYPIANQIADKVCAMYERHGVYPSSRYHDLYDVALIARELTVDSADLDTALRQQCSVRNLQLPDRVEIPDAAWNAQYPAKAKVFGSANPDLCNLEAALHVVGQLVNPILDGSLSGANHSWDCKASRWV